jgi:glycosyltransferase involved in cell wall biosynthesis
MKPIRLTVVLTHPIQYYAAWFRHIDANAPEVALTVLHAIEPTPEQQGVGFERPFTWDVPLTEGYRAVTVRPARPGDDLDSANFRGLDVPEIGDAIARTSPNVVLVAGWQSITLVRALVRCRRLGIPVLYRGDSHLLSGPVGWRRTLWAVKTWFLLRQFAGFLAPGRRVRDYLRSFGVPVYRIFDVPHGVDNALFAAVSATHADPASRVAQRRAWGIDADAFVPLFVGKLTESKRPHGLMRAAARLGKGVSVLVVGSGPLEGRIRGEATHLGVDLRLVGFLNQTELGKAYAAADCLVLPSDHAETWGLVVNEALASGLPVIASDAVGCVPDLVKDDETGYSYPLDDECALADRLTKMRNRKADGHDWQPQCRAQVAAYGHEAMTKGLVRACRSVLQHSVEAEPQWDQVPVRILAGCGLMVIPGGLERMSFEVVRGMCQRGARAHCIVNGWEHFRITPLAEAAGASWSVGPYWYPLTRRGLTPLKVARMILEIGRVSAHMWCEARRVKPTHIFLPDLHAILRHVPVLLWMRLRGVQVIARLGNAPAPGRFYSTLWRYIVAPFVDRFVCNSDFTRRELLALGVARSKVLSIPNTVTPRQQAWRADRRRISGRVIFVGQIIPEKGLDLLLEAIAMLRQRGHNVTLDVVGDMDGWEAPSYRGYRQRLRERSAREDLADAVSFLGWREDVPLLMARASIHCCPSRPEQREAFGNVVLEAKVSGLPSVVGPSGDLPELVAHGENGWVCGEATAEALAEGIEFFLRRPDKLFSASKAALESAATFSAERFREAWAQVFA